MTRNVFIVGAPRSGTTLLGDVLDLHPQVGRWYEPYFILDHYFYDALHDCRTATDATDEVKAYISSAFDYYRRKCRCNIVVDKSPRNSLKIPFLREVFPQARFIHILRDGRDVTLSINKEWQRRRGIIGENKDLLQVTNTVKNFLARQPLFKHKVAALRFELNGFTNVLDFQNFLHKSRWEGRIGWGPRFKGWQTIIDRVSMVEFNALQWAKCVEAIQQEHQQQLKDSVLLEIRYETLLSHPHETFEKIFDFLEIPFPADFMSQLPPLKTSNYNKWKKGFTKEEKSQIGPILNPLLIQLGYENDDTWYEH
ncbi:sulfotransferase [Chloroflexota bacterium]